MRIYRCAPAVEYDSCQIDTGGKTSLFDGSRKQFFGLFVVFGNSLSREVVVGQETHRFAIVQIASSAIEFVGQFYVLSRAVASFIEQSQQAASLGIIRIVGFL